MITEKMIQDILDKHDVRNVVHDIMDLITKERNAHETIRDRLENRLNANIAVMNEVGYGKSVR